MVLARLGSAAFLIGLLLASCELPATGSVTPAGPGGSSSPSSGLATGCEPINLRTLSGDQVDLTGTWASDDQMLYFVAQDESCVWWEALNEVPADQDRPHGCCLRTVFAGQLRGDLTVVGRFAVIYRSPTFISPGAQGVVFPQHGDAEWRVIDEAGELVLHGESMYFVNGDRYAVVLTRISERTDLP